MTGKRWLVAAVVATVLAVSGCATCGSTGYGLAEQAGPNCEVPTAQRNQVYVFAVSSLNPASVLALDKFREEVNKQGFAKVASGQIIHTSWMASEMQRIHKEQPDAVFVIVGTDSGGTTAVTLAEKVQAVGVPVTAFVLIDAEGKTPLPNLGMRTLWVGGYGLGIVAGVESVTVADAGRYTLASNSETVSAVAKLLNEIAVATPQPVVEEVAAFSYPHAPPARPIVEVGRDLEWNFLFDQPGGQTRAINDGETVMVAKPTPPTNTAAHR